MLNLRPEGDRPNGPDASTCFTRKGDEGRKEDSAVGEKPANEDFDWLGDAALPRLISSECSLAQPKPLRHFPLRQLLPPPQIAQIPRRHDGERIACRVCD